MAQWALWAPRHLLPRFLNWHDCCALRVMPVGFYALFPWVTGWVTHAIKQVGLGPACHWRCRLHGEWRHQASREWVKWGTLRWVEIACSFVPSLTTSHLLPSCSSSLLLFVMVCDNDLDYGWLWDQANYGDIGDASIFRQVQASQRIIALRPMFLYVSCQLLLCCSCRTCPDFSRGATTPPFISNGGKVTRKLTESVITWSQSGLYLYLSILHIFLSI
jgi:hypothetical protein